MFDVIATDGVQYLFKVFQRYNWPFPFEVLE